MSFTVSSAPKLDGDIRVCVDTRGANEAIVRERHPIPIIKKILYDLNDSTVFSKIDLKWGFHQLEESSQEITMFTIHPDCIVINISCLGTLPHWKSIRRSYQKIISDVIQGCSGVANIADDLIVHGADLEEHDCNLYTVLERL